MRAGDQGDQALDELLGLQDEVGGSVVPGALELELQAEVDKFVTTALLAQEQGKFALMRNLHKLLFDEVVYQPTRNRLERERYELATSYAARFCRRLLERVARDNGSSQLRKFYRLGQAEKMSYIHTLAWET